jgi:prophage DNA circulation protein
METYVAQLDDYILNILDIGTTQAQALVKHEYINTDGAVIENMGAHPQELKFKTYWMGDNAPVGNKLNSSYFNHFTFVDSIADSTVTHTLVHPKYGQITGYVENYVLFYDETQEYATIDISFVQDGIQNSSIISNETIELALAQVDLVNSQLNKTADLFTQSGFGQVLGQAVDFSKSLNSQFNSVTAPVSAFLKQTDQALSLFDQFLYNISIPAGSVSSMCNFVTDIPSRVVSSMLATADRIVGSVSNLTDLPINQTTAMLAQVNNINNSLIAGGLSFYSPTWMAIAAGNVAVQTGVIMQADDNNRKAAEALEQVQTFDSAGNRVSTVVIPVILSSPQIDTILYQIRDLIQMVLDMDRDNQQLKDMAAELIIFVNDIKLKKMQQVTMTVNNIPLHILCLQLGIPYNAADRIFALNPGILNPSFLEGQVQVYID